MWSIQVNLGQPPGTEWDEERWGGGVPLKPAHTSQPFDFLSFFFFNFIEV